MSVRKQIAQKDGVFFITFTCAAWLPLFNESKGYAVIYNWFNHLKKEGHHIVGFVIMPNHLHAVIAFRNTGKPINTIVANGKRFIAYELVKLLQQNGRSELISYLQSLTSATERKQGKVHRVFEPSFDWKECRTHHFIIQKLNYIHWNPCKAKLAELPENYVHSSAGYYITGEHGKYKITSYMELEDIDLTAPL